MPIGYYPNKGELENRGRPSIGAFGRMKPGVTIEQARADMNAIAARIAEVYPATNAGITETVREGLQVLAAKWGYEGLRKLRGKVKFSINLKELREDRR